MRRAIISFAELVREAASSSRAIECPLRRAIIYGLRCSALSTIEQPARLGRQIWTLRRAITYFQFAALARNILSSQLASVTGGEAL